MDGNGLREKVRWSSTSILGAGLENIARTSFKVIQFSTRSPSLSNNNVAHRT